MTGFTRLFSEGFRVFFLAAGLYAVFALIVWTGWLGVHAAGGMVSDLPFAMPPHLWHAHEMVFGYPSAAIGGFLLTAVPNWTGARPAPARFVALAAGLWLAGRIAVWFSGDLSPATVAVIDLAFLPLLCGQVALQLLQRPKPQNLMLLGLVTLVWSGNLMVHLEWAGLTADTAWAGLRAGLYGTCAMIAVLGGRITPAFTRNAMQRAGRSEGLPVSHRWIELPAVLLAIALPLAWLAGLPEAATGLVALAAGLAQFARLAGWRSGWTRGQPILWTLHLSIALLGLGYLAAGLAAFGQGSEVAALHLLGIGAVGGMTLAVMSRATLGHSGRALVAPGAVVASYLLLPLAAAARWAASALGIAWYYPGVLGSGLLWILAFTLYAAALWPAFCGPREIAAPAAAE